MFDDNFSAKYVISGRIELWKGYRMWFNPEEDQWELQDEHGYIETKGTIDECAKYYIEHNLAAR